MDGAGHVVPESELDMPNPRYTRSPRPTSEGDFQAAEENARSKPGYGEAPDGYKRPKGAGDKLRYVLLARVLLFERSNTLICGLDGTCLTR